jgi:hypothetical protein
MSNSKNGSIAGLVVKGVITLAVAVVAIVKKAGKNKVNKS